RAAWPRGARGRRATRSAGGASSSRGRG
ncbi:MAG: hypothetical protein AVDCRST_MAG11-925, partial [uncultured Gemmatimonadaceae bacterium]